jgi:hypothetical protein
MTYPLRAVCVLGWLFAATTLPVQAGTITTISTGFSLPEDIVPVPAGFGSLAAGSYLVTDPTQGFTGPGTIYDVPAGGGTPTVFANLGVVQPIGGLFLPSAYGADAGDFLAIGRDSSTGVGDVAVVNSSGTPAIVDSGVGTLQFADAAVAPAGFDSAGGDVIMVNEDGNLSILNPDFSTSPLPGGVVPNTATSYPFGLAFAPSGFGAVSGDLLITNGDSGALYALSPSGSLSLFTTIPLGPGQVGLRQLAFAPAGFGAYGGDLLVSVSGSVSGGGIAGSVDVLNSSGNVVAYLAEGSVGNPYDPRGLYFSGSNVLVADADPSIFSAPASAFTPGSPVPEPSTALLMLLGLPVLWVARSARKASRS